MIQEKILTLLKVSETLNFTKAAKELNLTQPAVSHHIKELENELDCELFIRKKGALVLTKEGKVALKYAKRLKSISDQMKKEILDAKRKTTSIKIGITHTAESNIMVEVLAKYANEVPGLYINIITDTIKNLYDKLEAFEIDIAIVEGKNTKPNFNSIMLDTDYLVCVLNNNNPLAKKSIITLNDLKKENLILRGKDSATRILFESALESINESLELFNVTIVVDNVATIKDLIMKNLGVSILAKSACISEVKKNKLKVLPIENLSMIRDTNIVYHSSFANMDLIDPIIRIYNETIKSNNN